MKRKTENKKVKGMVLTKDQLNALYEYRWKKELKLE